MKILRIVLLLLFLGAVVVFYITRHREPITLPTPLETPNTTASINDRLIIPAINLDTPVGSSCASNFDLNFNTLLPKPLVVCTPWLSAIGQPGLSLIIGHRSHLSHPMQFAKLNELITGDELILYGHKYKVIGSTETPADGYWPVLHKEADSLASGQSVTAFLTCTPFGTDWRRLIVYVQRE